VNDKLANAKVSVPWPVGGIFVRRFLNPRRTRAGVNLFGGLGALLDRPAAASDADQLVEGGSGRAVGV
jgi:hypothetical protein